jgi:hypothetical protein
MGIGVRIKFKPGNLRIQEIFWRGSEWVFGIGVAFEKFIRSTICRVPAALERNRNKRDYRGESVRAAIVELARPWTRVLARPNQNRGCNGVWLDRLNHKFHAAATPALAFLKGH